MYKNFTALTCRRQTCVYSKIVRVMKLLCILLMATIFQVNATITSAQKISVQYKDAQIEDVLLNIQKQSGYDFLYSAVLLKSANPVTISIANASINQVLDKCMANQPFSYIINQKTVTINAKPYSKPKDNPIRGRVIDETGKPIPGVTIKVKGASQVALTDNMGNFSMTVPDLEVILEVSSIGFEKLEYPVSGRSSLEITLKSSSSDLTEVVVVAYGTQKKATVTGAISSISTKEIKQSPSANLAVTLAGRLPGLTSIQTTGEPGRDNVGLYLRGRGTLNGQNPLILVDGVERDLGYIDPNEVDNVTILKDASSTALFGVRGANGVILVTTKRGNSNKPGISLSFERGIQSFTRTQSTLDSYTWASLKNEAWRNDNPTADPANPANQPPYSEYALERFRLQDFPEAYPNNDWTDILMHKYVPQTRVNLNLSGGGDYVKYFVNVGHLDQGGQWKTDPDLNYDPSSFLKRYNFRSNIDAALNKSKTLKTFLNVAGYLEKVNAPNEGSAEIFRRTYTYFPVIVPGPLTPNGEVLIGSGIYSVSPWAYVNRSGYRQETRSNITASWGLDLDLKMVTPGLSTKFMASFDTRTNYNLVASKTWQNWVQIIDPNSTNPDGTDKIIYQRSGAQENTPLSTSTATTFQSFSNFQYFINYNRTFGEKHNVTGLILAQQESRIRPNDRLPYNLRGLSSRFSYGYDNKYFAEFNAGYNGSEQFAKGQRYGFFPSFSAGWVISQESFLKDNSIISLLKLRASVGQVGSDQLGGRRFLYLDDIQRAGGGYSSTLGRGGIINENFIGNPNIQWEVAEKKNIGLELGLLNQLTLSVDVFKENRDNVLISRGSVPILAGIDAGKLGPANIGVIENHGYELELNYNKTISSDFSIVSKLNFNYAKNKVIFVDEPMRTSDYATRYRSTGYSIGQQFGYQTNGYYNSQNEITQSGLTYVGRAPRPGDFRYIDQNNDGVIDDRDIVAIGNTPLPEYTFGGALSFNYKNFDLSILVQGALKNSGQYLGDAVFEQYDFRGRHAQAWTPERAASGQDILYPALSLAQSSSEQANSFFTEDRSFIRLKNAEFGYNFSSKLAHKVGAQSMRLYVNGLNLFTWDRMKFKDIDPEVASQTTYPVYRVFNAGFNVIF